MLDFIYYPVSGIMWVWHWLFSHVTPASPGGDGIAWALSVVFLVFTLRAILYKPFVKQIRTTKKMQEINPQLQTRISWADSADVAQSYLDQLARSNGLEADLATRAGAVVTGWRGGTVDKQAAGRLVAPLRAAAEKATGAGKTRLTALADLFGRVSA